MGSYDPVADNNDCVGFVTARVDVQTAGAPVSAAKVGQAVAASVNDQVAGKRGQVRTRNGMTVNYHVLSAVYDPAAGTLTAEVGFTPVGGPYPQDFLDWEPVGDAMLAEIGVGQAGTVRVSGTDVEYATVGVDYDIPEGTARYRPGYQPRPPTPDPEG